jgi:hypothetical protein
VTKIVVRYLFSRYGLPMGERDHHFSEMRPQVPLAEYPGELVNLACSKCDRQGKLSKARLIAEHGANKGLVDLLNLLSMDCPKAKKDWQGLTSCGAYYPDLKKQTGTWGPIA